MFLLTNPDLHHGLLGLANATSHFAGIVPVSCSEHGLLSTYRLGLLGKRVGVIRLTNFQFLVVWGSGFSEPRKHLQPSHRSPHASDANARAKPLSGQDWSLSESREVQYGSRMSGCAMQAIARLSHVGLQADQPQMRCRPLSRK